MGMMKISMFGIDGLYNYGCEAIIRGTFELLRTLPGGPEDFSYYSLSPEGDGSLIQDIPVAVKDMRRPLSLMERAVNKGLRRLGASSYILPYRSRAFVRQTDLYVSIGGDILTIPQNVRQASPYPYYNKVVDFGNKVIPRVKQALLLGASVGPFGDYDKAVAYYLRHLQRYDHIFVREYESLSYLQSLGLKNVSYFPDPAFFVPSPPAADQPSERRFIGLNLSPLSFYELCGRVTPEHIKQLAGLTERLIQETGYSILLIPHVISPAPLDNDLTILAPLYDELHARYPEKIRLLPAGLGFSGSKAYLRQCALTLCARMHCNINSFCEETPTVFLSYSQKSIGMCELLYGNKAYVCSVQDCGQAAELALDLLDRQEEMRRLFREKREAICAHSFAAELARVLGRE